MRALSGWTMPVTSIAVPPVAMFAVPRSRTWAFGAGTLLSVQPCWRRILSVSASVSMKFHQLGESHPPARVAVCDRHEVGDGAFAVAYDQGGQFACNGDQSSGDDQHPVIVAGKETVQENPARILVRRPRWRHHTGLVTAGGGGHQLELSSISLANIAEVRTYSWPVMRSF
jgi:hypothetical protein